MKRWRRSTENLNLHKRINQVSYNLKIFDNKNSLVRFNSILVVAEYRISIVKA